MQSIPLELALLNFINDSIISWQLICQLVDGKDIPMCLLISVCDGCLCSIINIKISRAVSLLSKLQYVLFIFLEYSYQKVILMQLLLRSYPSCLL